MTIGFAIFVFTTNSIAMKNSITLLLLLLATTIFAESVAKPQPQPQLVVDNMPQFKGGGLRDFQEWVTQEITKRDATKIFKDRVVATFILEPDGTVSTIEFVGSPNKKQVNTLTEVIKSSPKWRGGTHKGEPARVKYTIPVKL